MKRWGTRIVQLLLVVAMAGALIYWLRFAPVRIEPHPVHEGTVVDEVLGTGTLEARVRATVSSKIAGRIAEIRADQGDRVSKGTPLVRLDDAELQQQVAIAQANLATAEAAIMRAQAARGRANVLVDQARRELTRDQQLYNRSALSRETLDRSDEALQVANASLTEAEASLTQAERDRVAAERTLDYQRARLDDTTILAPFDGLIVRRERDPGDVVVPGGSILTLVSTEELWISAWVDETRMAGVAERHPARVVFRSEPDRSYAGEVARLGREADRETREYVVDVRVDCLPQHWAIGQRAEVFIETARKSAVPTLPLRYVVWRDSMPGAFVLTAGAVHWRSLQLGLQGQEVVEVLDGLRTGDTVAVPANPRESLTDGRRVLAP